MSEGSYLLCYDIANPRRLGKVHKFCSRLGMAFQYSVFHLRCDSDQATRIMADLEAIIDPEEDDVRLYPIDGSDSIATFGERLLPDEIFLL